MLLWLRLVIACRLCLVGLVIVRVFVPLVVVIAFTCCFDCLFGLSAFGCGCFGLICWFCGL